MTRSRSITFTTLSFAALLVAACSPPPPPPAPPPPPPPIPGPQSVSERTLLTMATDLAFSSGSYTLRPAGRAEWKVEPRSFALRSRVPTASE